MVEPADSSWIPVSAEVGSRSEEHMWTGSGFLNFDQTIGSQPGDDIRDRRKSLEAAF